MIFLGTAIVLGLASSLHCLGMCGPLLSVLPWNNTKGGNISSPLLHHSGRILSYGLLGVIGGIIGKSLSLFGFQQWLSIFAGVAMILLLLFKKKIDAKITLFTNPIKNIHQKKGLPIQAKIFLLGSLNGFLPCGMVYAALGASIAGDGILNSVLFMITFGLGTLPALLGFSMIQAWLTSKLKANWKVVSNYLLAIMAVIFILRGLNLGIPFLSPKMNPQVEDVSCCHGE